MMNRVFVSLLVLLPAVVLSAPTCPTGLFTVANQPIADGDAFFNRQVASCVALCSNPNLCVHNAADLTPLKPCLNITTPLPSKIKKLDLSRLKGGACVIVAIPLGADITFGPGNDCLTVNGSGRSVNNVDFGDGDDFAYIGTGAGAKILKGAGGNDIFDLNTATATKILGDDGADIVYIKAGIVDTIDLGDGSDTVFLNKTGTFVNKIDTGAGSDFVYVNGSARAGTIISGNGDDTVGVGAGSSANTVKLGRGSDTLALSATATVNQKVVDQSDSICTLT